MSRPRRVLTLLVAGAGLSLAATGAGPAAPPAAAAPPKIQAPAAILVESATGDVIFRREPRRERPIASATKLMTALLTLEQAKLDDVFTHPGYDAHPAESRINLQAGEKMTVRDLLAALMLESANDAAVALAENISGSRAEFVEQMNQRARQLGLRDTHFANPIGLDEEGNYSTPADLVRLAKVLRRYPVFRDIVSMRRAELRSGNRVRVVGNRNDLVGAERYVNGVKTGHTPLAGYVLVGSATRGGVTVLSAVLGEPSEAARNADTLALLRYGLSRYRRRTVVEPGKAMASAAVVHREEQRVGLETARGLTRVMRTTDRPRITVRAPTELEGPIPAGRAVGEVVVRLRGRVIDRIPLVTASAVPKVGFFERAEDAVIRPATLAGVAGVLAALMVLVAALLRRRRRRGGEATMETETA